MKRIQCLDREQWLAGRRLGGSDAATIIHMNKYKSNVDLYLEKVGIKKPADLSKNLRVQHGNAAEPIIRELFKINFPEYQMYYREFELLVDDEHDFMTASLDGELTHPELGKGVWEAKSTEPRNKEVLEEWNGSIPGSYFCQLIHNMMVSNYQYAILSALILHRTYDGSLPNQENRNYFFDRKDVEEDISYLREKEIDFWNNHIIPRIAPSAVLKLGV